MCYSTDMMKKFTFEKEIEHLKSHPEEYGSVTVTQYMVKELERIKKEYGEEPVRE